MKSLPQGHPYIQLTACRLLCFDNPTAGLDSSTAILFAQVIRAYVNENHCGCVMSMYQTGDALSQYFDKVLVINKGHQIYFGPIQAAIGYFERLGFYKPPESTFSEFLTSMSGDGSSWVAKEGFSGLLPRTAEDLATLFRESEFSETLALYLKSNELRTILGRAVAPCTYCRHGAKSTCAGRDNSRYTLQIGVLGSPKALRL